MWKVILNQEHTRDATVTHARQPFECLIQKGLNQKQDRANWQRLSSQFLDK